MLPTPCVRIVVASNFQLEVMEMVSKFTQSFKEQAVEKALQRKEGVCIKEIADTLGVGFSTLQKWIRLSKDQKLSPDSSNDRQAMTNEKRPQDWNAQERLEMVIACDSLDDEAISTLCRKKGIYLHHVKQWKNDFINGSAGESNTPKQPDNKSLKSEIKSLKKQLNRKDKALAETAALLVLQKKVNDIWGSDDEDGSQ